VCADVSSVKITFSVIFLSLNEKCVLYGLTVEETLKGCRYYVLFFVLIGNNLHVINTDRVAQKTGTLCFVRLNFVKYWLIQTFFTVRIRRKFVIVLSLKIHHTSSVSLHDLVKWQYLKSNNWKRDEICNNTFWEYVVQQQGGHIEHLM